MSETLVPIKKTNSWAVVSLVLGIVSLPMACCGSVFPPAACIALPAAIAAIVFGFIARRDIKASEGTQTGEGLALTGMILGAILIALIVLSCGVITVLTLLGGEVESVFENISDSLQTQ